MDAEAGAVTGRAETVLVTGATRGIGRAVLDALVARGAIVVAAGRDEAALDAARGAAPAQVHPLRVDLGIASERAACVASAGELAGELTGLVQCAGVVRYADLDALTEEDLRLQLEVDLIAPLLLARDFAAHLTPASRGGAIVNVASTLALRPARGLAAYSAAKAGLVAATRAIAAELAPAIRVNAVAPGVVDTDMVRVPRTEGGSVEAQLEELRTLHPLGRLGRPSDVAAAVVHLLDAEWTTGSVFVVDGGLLAV
jgi:NAD(P)-dependent dehydrogenase (short-subunit alcohol dehydrogenase family)